MEKADILNILRADKTVFSFKDILLASEEGNPALLRRRINYYIKKGELYPIRRGFYAKDKNYNKNELATKIYTPSYISFETVLGKAGITFQYYSQIFIVSYLTREITADRQIYSYRKIKESVLTNSAGIEHKDNYSIATPERAFLDVVYLNKDYHFDNLSVLDWNRVMEILPIYSNKRTEKEVKSYQENI
ncbi:type IV toxin-antitoxin system AbiEi family antitoxin domain-containing protein [Patescibacteria group bacterium]|nr:type IV toxin-antitoxin system AbiEi family antitoxin domain-containing protein [Patescibacteria group bacterium]MBU4023443.1 type IV toxin-antitoxin system AbiEi family antitoxin domain-containing protein [Patescibacteria group bacterium]MBU4078059.1 type IV toxin-antitoxin system AbiEi family antitoxin domain-containing protein [Patescibacteria group bacterium]